jgi:hypothetical protein
LGGKEVLDFYQEPQKQNFHFCYINANKNYLINKVDCLLKGKKTIMFINNEKFYIHKVNEFCAPAAASLADNPIENDNVVTFVKNMYPKQKYLILAFEIMHNHQLIDSNLFFVQFPNLHVADVCAFLNNRFGKSESTDPRFIKLCKFLHQKKIKFPKVAIKNPVAQKLLC